MQERTGVFCDSEKEGKAFYAISQVLSLGYPNLKNIKTSSIDNIMCNSVFQYLGKLIYAFNSNVIHSNFRLFALVKFFSVFGG
jgi:hypothetical protein